MLDILNEASLDISVSNFLKDLGYGCTSSQNILEIVLKQIGVNLESLKEKDIASILIMMAHSNSGLEESPMLESIIPSSNKQEYRKLTTWDIKLFIESLRKKVC